MKIGDVAAPSALLRSPAPHRGGTSFVQTLGSVQRAYHARRPPRLYEVAERKERAREFEVRRQRVEDAARKLSATGPEAEYTHAEDTEVADVERVKTSREVVTRSEVEHAATAASQQSKAFASANEVIAANKSRLHLRFAEGRDLKIKVGRDGASLRDLADMINADAENEGRAVADVVSDSEGFRLRIRTTEEGSGATLDIQRDQFKTPEGDKFQLIDRDLARSGKDEVTETTTTTETVTGTTRKVTLREVESLQRLDDQEYEAAVREFADAYNALRSFTDEEGLDVGDDAGLLGSDDRVRSMARSLDELAGGLEARASTGERTLAEIGVALGEDGMLRVDAERLHAALERDTDSVVELLNGAESGLGRDLLSAVTPEPTASNRDPAGSFVAFLEGLSGREQVLEQRASVLENVVSSLSGGGAERA